MTLEGAEVCQPRWRDFPSGRRIVHGDECRLWPGQKIDKAHPWHDTPPEGEPISCTEGHRKCAPVMRGSVPLTDPDGMQRMIRVLFHADDCPASPGKRISAKEYAKGRRW